MSDEQERELTPEELEAQEAQELPDREAMSLVNANVAAPINLAAALNVLSDGAAAGAPGLDGARAAGSGGADERLDSRSSAPPDRTLTR